MIKVSHEIPKALFDAHDFINDYPYVLAHLLMKDTEHYDAEYAAFYREKLKTVDYSILDNSCYELGAPIDEEILHRLGEEYLPTHLVIPDVYQNMEGTIKSARRYINKFGKVSYPDFFVVVQGTSMEEYLECYRFFLEQESIDIIGVNFKTLSDGTTRLDFLHEILEREDVSKKIHMLGCTTAYEFNELDDEMKEMVYSVDTSAPIVHGWHGNEFMLPPREYPKPEAKIADNLDIDLSLAQIKTIAHNVKMFRSFIH